MTAKFTFNGRAKPVPDTSLEGFEVPQAKGPVVVRVKNCHLRPTTASMVRNTARSALGAVLFGAACMVLLLAHPARSQQVCTLKLKIVSATGVNNGNDNPEAYAVAKLNGKEVCKTPYVQRTNPVWNTQCPTRYNSRFGKVSLAFEVWDEDAGFRGGDDLLGKATRTLSQPRLCSRLLYDNKTNRHR